MSHLDALNTRYGPLLQKMKDSGLVVTDVHQEGLKLAVSAVAGSDAAKNQIWDVVKATHSAWEADLILDIKVDPAAAPASAAAPAPAARTYTVKGGDTLSKIAKEFYG